MKALAMNSLIHALRPFLTFASRGGAIALLLTVAACQTAPETDVDATTDATEDTTEATAAGDGGPFRLGTLLPLTGDLAQYGQTMQDTATLFVDTVNTCGGVMGQDIELISEDDQTDPAAGSAGMTKLAEVDEVGAVIGAAGSAVSSAAVDIAVRNEVVQISPSSTSPTFTERAAAGDFEGFWARTAPPDTFQGNALAQLAQEQGFESISILSINNDYGNGLIEAFIPAFEELGGTVVNADNPAKYAENATTFDTELQAAFADAPDAVLIVGYLETGSLILKSAYELGLTGGDTQILLTDGMKSDDLAGNVGQTPDGNFIATGVIGTAPSAGGPAIDDFNALYTERFDRDPNVFDPNTWDAAAVLTLAAEAAQSSDGAAIRDALSDVSNAPGEPVSDVCAALELVRAGEDIDYQGASGTVDFNAEGDVVGSYDVWTITDDGSLEVLSVVNVEG